MVFNTKRFVKAFNKKPNLIIAQLNQLIEMGYVNKNQHQEYPNLAIYNYTRQTTFQRFWTPLTLVCRGLVLDLDKKEILALPFPKFFNYNELADTEYYQLSNVTPGKSYEVYEKLDGSLGIGFVYNDKIIWSTRGSFHSDQANFANTFFKNKYSKKMFKELSFNYTNMTLLAEIIYPQNKIVVNYGKLEDMVLLGMVRNKDGLEIPYNDLCLEADELNLSVVDKYTTKDLNRLLKERTLWDKDMEGVVIRYENGKRIKIKGESYLDTHRIVYGLSLKGKIKHWYEGTYDSVLTQLPEEFRDEAEELRGTLDDIFKTEYQDIVSICDDIKRKEIPQQRIMYHLNSRNVRKYKKGWVFSYLNTNKKDEELKNSIKEFIYRNYLNYFK